MPEKKYSSFYLGESLFGIDILLVREINRTIDLTPVDLASESIRGLINLRGQLVTIFDLGIQLGKGKTSLSKKSRCMVLKTSSEISAYHHAGLLNDTSSDDMVGLLVDRIGDILSVDVNDIDNPPANVAGVERKFIHGIVKLETELLIILKVSELLSIN
jgi:purine-binding chemotaxis protein CheW